MNRWITTLSACAAVLAIHDAVAEESAGRFGLSAGADYGRTRSSGLEDTKTAYLPVVGRYETDNWLIKITVPWVSITGSGNIVGGDQLTVVNQSNANRGRRESGLGDIVTSVTWTAIATGSFVLDLTGKVKLGTAEKAKGLGTGENDYSGQVDVYQSFGKTTLLAGLGYRRYGDMPDLVLKDVPFGSLGLTYKAAPAATVGAIFDYRPPIVEGRKPIAEFTPFLSYKFGPDDKVQLYGVYGLTQASTRFGGGFLYTHMF